MGFVSLPSDDQDFRYRRQQLPQVGQVARGTCEGILSLVLKRNGNSRHQRLSFGVAVSNGFSDRSKLACKFNAIRFFDDFLARELPISRKFKNSRPVYRAVRFEKFDNWVRFKLVFRLLRLV